MDRELVRIEGDGWEEAEDRDSPPLCAVAGDCDRTPRSYRPAADPEGGGEWAGVRHLAGLWLDSLHGNGWPHRQRYHRVHQPVEEVRAAREGAARLPRLADTARDSVAINLIMGHSDRGSSARPRTTARRAKRRARQRREETTHPSERREATTGRR